MPGTMVDDSADDEAVRYRYVGRCFSRTASRTASRSFRRSAIPIRIPRKVDRSSSSRVYALPGEDRRQPKLAPLTLPRGAGGWTNGEKKVTVGGGSVRLAGIDREPFAELFFGVECIRSEGKTTVHLTVDQVDFGVKNCCTGVCSGGGGGSCITSCKTAFIYKMTIEVTPESWAQYCRRLTVQPEHTTEVFQEQRTHKLSIQTPMLNPTKASISFGREEAVGYLAREFGWKPARKDAASHSAIFPWEISRHANHAKLKFKHSLGTRRNLAIPPGNLQILSKSLLKASWELGPNAPLQQHRLAWNVKVTLHTAVLRSTGILWNKITCYSIKKGLVLSYQRLLMI